MSSSFGHCVYPLNEKDQKHADENRRPCSVHCDLRVTHVTIYTYRTSKYSGRTATSRRWVCAEHAEKFAQRNNITVNNEPEPLAEQDKPVDLTPTLAATVTLDQGTWYLKYSDPADGGAISQPVDLRGAEGNLTLAVAAAVVELLGMGWKPTGPWNHTSPHSAVGIVKRMTDEEIALDRAEFGKPDPTIQTIGAATALPGTGEGA